MAFPEEGPSLLALHHSLIPFFFSRLNYEINFFNSNVELTSITFKMEIPPKNDLIY